MLAISQYPAGNYMFKVNNRNTRTRCEICSKLTIKIPERRQWRRSGIFIVNFEHILHLVLVFLLLTLSRYMPIGYKPALAITGASHYSIHLMQHTDLQMLTIFLHSNRNIASTFNKIILRSIRPSPNRGFRLIRP